MEPERLGRVACPTNSRGSKMMRLTSAAILAASVTAFVGLNPARSFADERCQQLEALHARYAGVELTAYQKVLKRKLVAWYHEHCGDRHVVADER
jgi:hypothetical protein